MAFIVITADTDEIEHRELTGPLTIGRSFECDVSIRDVLLSRKHCRFEAIEGDDDHWVVVDLDSKNQTKVNGQVIDRHVLDDGDVVRVGKTRMMFNAGVFTAPSNDARRRRIRAADPHEAMAGTVAGFELLEPGSTPKTDFFPTPQPSPRRPRAYEEEKVESLLSGIASSSWDSIVTGVRVQTRTVRATPKPVMREVDVMRALQSDEDLTADEAMEEPEKIEHARDMLENESAFSDEPRALTVLEGAARQLQNEAMEMDLMAIDALHALGAAVAEVKASELSRLAAPVAQNKSIVRARSLALVPSISIVVGAFKPTPGATEMRFVAGMVAAASALVAAGGLLIRLAAGF